MIESARILPIVPTAAFLLLVGGSYLVMFTAAGGQTIGKMIAGLRVVGGDSSEADETLTFGKAAYRSLLALPSALVFWLLLRGRPSPREVAVSILAGCGGAALALLVLAGANALAGSPPAFLLPRETVMWRNCLISLGLLAIVLTACDPQLLVATSDPGDYEVVALIAR